MSFVQNSLILHKNIKLLYKHQFSLILTLLSGDFDFIIEWGCKKIQTVSFFIYRLNLHEIKMGNYLGWRMGNEFRHFNNKISRKK